MKSKIFKKNGFTLVEVLLYVLIAGTLLLGVSGMLIFVLSSEIRNSTITEVEQQGQFATDVIGQALRGASGINAPTIGTSGSSASASMTDSAKNPTVIDVANGILRIKEGAAVPIELTSPSVQVSNFSVSNYSLAGTTGSLEVKFTLSRTNIGGRREYNYSQIFYVSSTIRP